MFSGGMYNFGSNKIHEHCPHCNLHFEIEPGYFYAAMYVSYALNVAEAFGIVAVRVPLCGLSTRGRRGTNGSGSAVQPALDTLWP